MNDGNVNEALTIYKALLLNPEVHPKEAGQDLHSAISCLQQLRRIHEVDEMRNAAITFRKNQPEFLLQAAASLENGPHYGRILSGEFKPSWPYSA